MTVGGVAARRRRMVMESLPLEMTAESSEARKGSWTGSDVVEHSDSFIAAGLAEGYDKLDQLLEEL